jgi:hypothetical protein
MVGAIGFEPTASWSRTRRASQAALRPDCHAQPHFPPSATNSLSQALRHIYTAKNRSSAPRALLSTVNSLQNKTAGKLASPGGTVISFKLALELVAQCELHYARVGQQTRVVTE